MSSIDHFDLRSFDLNLLVAFDALIQERNVTRAATRLKIRQPAMSHSLATLRVLLQDELFVRVGQTMQPTARAHLLAPRVRLALQHMQDVLHWEESFDPAVQQRTFRLGFSSELELLVMPELAVVLRRVAPGLKLLGRPIADGEVHDLLDNGAIDVAVGCFDYSASRHRGRKLFDQSLACCFNRDLLDLEVPIGTDAYLLTEHALISLNNTLQGCLDNALGRAQAQLNVVLAGSEFLTLFAAASAAPLITTVPNRLASRYGPMFGLTTSPVPLDLDIPPVSMIWSAQSDRDPAVTWLREWIERIIERQEPTPLLKLEQVDARSG
ncbi:LysR family transcriptional regulator [Phyllobacterium salinisoli]|uniref:LysR family transcriptional regulator n=1 Tax=Phyllobacterium salinisoli TaxID=1899321 RepID=A0A368JX94_9HYPH|nr:LysR family transcriptional regulator [Phyllobacterium salinisoli]RCS21779.1 LysR family transcriptional regulator [Phyllobacterium salinisoli]